jgi:PAS domain-containing protein
MNCASCTKTKVLRLRLKDKHARLLSDLAHEVNFVWNYCNELQITVFNRERRFLSGYDFAEFTRGATKEGLHLHSQTVQAIAEEYATRRRQFRKVRLSWRKSTGSRRSLGWIPFKKTAIQAAHGQVKFAGQWLSLWDSSPNPAADQSVGGLPKQYFTTQRLFARCSPNPGVESPASRSSVC